MKLQAYDKLEKKEREQKRIIAQNNNNNLNNNNNNGDESVGYDLDSYETPNVNSSFSSTSSQNISNPSSQIKSDAGRNRSYSEISGRKSNMSTSTSSMDTNSSLKTQYIAENNHVTSNVSEEHLSSQLLSIISEYKLIISCGHWDHSLRITSLDTGKLIQSITLHSDVITCLAIAKDFNYYYIVTGSRDCTLIIWDHILLNKDEPLHYHPNVLYGHDDTVSTVAINPELNIIISGSYDGTIIIHSLRDYAYIRSIVNGYPNSITSSTNSSLNSSMNTATSQSVPSMKPSSNQSLQLQPITWIGISKENYIITYSMIEHKLCTYSINGDLLATKVVVEKIYALLISDDGNVLITGGNCCLLVFRWVSVIVYKN